MSCYKTLSVIKYASYLFMYQYIFFFLYLRLFNKKKLINTIPKRRLAVPRLREILQLHGHDH